MSILDDIKKNKSRPRNSIELTDDVIEASLAYLSGDITVANLSRAMNITSTHGYITVARALREAYQQGRIAIKM